MALVTTKRNVDVLPGQAAPTVFHCSQHDVGATIILGLVNAGGNFTIPSGVTAIIQGSCSNGAVFTPVTATVSGSDITFNLSDEMTSIAGPTVCEAVLSKDTDVLGTANFILDVEPSAMGSDTPPVFTDAAWLWMVDKMGSETVSALGNKTVIDAIESKLDKNQGTANAGKYLKVGADGNVEAAATDTTLSISGDAADAKAVGDEITNLKADLDFFNVTGVLNISHLEKGGWNGNVKDTYRQANRARTKRAIYVNNDVNISTKTNGNAKLYVTYYNNSFEVVSNTGWVNYALIKKGSIVNVMLTSSNSGTATETSISDILALFDIWDATPIVVNTPPQTYINGGIDPNNAIVAYEGRLITKEYTKADEYLVHFLPPTGMYVYVIGYDKDFKITKYGVNGGWLSGNNWLDLSAYAYYRFIIRKSDNSAIDPSDVTAIANKYVPRRSDTVLSVAKDGLNAENKNYAPKYPDNSIASFNAALKQGFDAIEIHLQYTSDGVGVLLHDLTINRVARNADGSAISTTVKISEHTLDELNQYDFGIAYGIPGLKILTLEEGVKYFKQKGVMIFIEPVTAVTQEQEDNVVAILTKYGMDKKCAYFSYNENVLNRIKTKLPYATLYLWCSDETQMLGYISFAEANLVTETNQFYFYTYNTIALTSETINRLKSANIGLIQQYLDGAEPSSIATTGNSYTTIIISQVVPASSVFYKLD